MKQGSTPTTVSGRKVEPRSHPISPRVAADIGLQQVRLKEVLMDPHGFLAPPAKLKSHKGGSQGGY